MQNKGKKESVEKTSKIGGNKLLEAFSFSSFFFFSPFFHDSKKQAHAPSYFRQFSYLNAGSIAFNCRAWSGWGNNQFSNFMLCLHSTSFHNSTFFFTFLSFCNCLYQTHCVWQKIDKISSFKLNLRDHCYK